MSACPEFLRPSTWAAMNDAERAAISALIIEAASAVPQLEVAHAQVEQYRSLSRKLADQAKALLEQMRRMHASATPPSVVGRMERLADDLAATASGAERREGSVEPGVAAYTPPVADDDDDDELRRPTLVGAMRPRK